MGALVEASESSGFCLIRAVYAFDQLSGRSETCSRCAANGP